MARKLKFTPQIFLDANVLISMGMPPSGPELTALVNLSRAEIIRLISTEHTIREVAKHHAERDVDDIQPLTNLKTRNKADFVLGIKIPEIDLSLLYVQKFKEYSSKIENHFDQIGIHILETDNINAAKILKNYSMKSGFFSFSNKKDQFPDAFIFESLFAAADSLGPITIISKDHDFEHACEESEFISLNKSVAEYFSHSGMEKIDISLDKLINNPDFLNKIEETLEGIPLFIMDIDEQNIISIKVKNFNPTNFTAFRNKSDQSALVCGNCKIIIEVNHSHTIDESEYKKQKMITPSRDYKIETSITDIYPSFSMTISLDKSNIPLTIDDFEITDMLIITVIDDKFLDI
ncbi:PIN domain-containing protein [Nisaea sediminum]|uniref:PIN domain-containing protein n=1 Tax=Nisaea sediminum TaxID=2775867 RepID=UPI0018667332|nr:PIN domain-containing protein [Nisaea sediminum]